MSRLKMTLLVTLCFSSLAPARQYFSYEPYWEGFVIWGAENKSKTVLVFNPLEAILTGADSDAGALCSYFLGNAAFSGIKKVYWRLDDGFGNLLYNSHDRDNVLKIANLALDFSKIDYPHRAKKFADQLGIKIRFAVDGKYLEEAKQLFPYADIVDNSSIPTQNAISQERMTNNYRWDVYKLAAQDLYTGDLYFRKKILVPEDIVKAELIITANKNYTVYIDSHLIGEDGNWWLGEVYDVTKLLSTGVHLVAVKVESGTDANEARGLLLNIELTDKNGDKQIIYSDSTWLCSTVQTNGWTEVDFDDSKWLNAFNVGFDGAVPWYRLQRSRNKMPLLYTQSRPLRNISVEVSTDDVGSEKIINASVSDLSSWTTSVPCEVILELEKPTFCREIRIYSGHVEYANNPSGHLGVDTYKIDAYSNGKWRNIVTETKTTDYKGQKSEDFFESPDFKPDVFEKIKITILTTKDTGRRVHCPDLPCVAQSDRVVLIREISVFGEESSN
jgi:hypothetical protein